MSICSIPSYEYEGFAGLFFFFKKKNPPLFLVVQFIVLRMVPMLHVALGAFASSTYGVPRRVTAINLLP